MTHLLTDRRSLFESRICCCSARSRLRITRIASIFSIAAASAPTLPFAKSLGGAHLRFKSVTSSAQLQTVVVPAC